MLSVASVGAGVEDPRPTESAGVWHGLEHQDLQGERWHAETLLGRVVLLDFWATWCAPCLAELPNLRRLHEDFGDGDFVLLGVNLDRTSRAALRSFLLRHDMPWPQLHDGRGLGGPVPRRFGVDVVPRTVVVDRRGRMVAVDLRGEALYTLVRDLQRDSSATNDRSRDALD